MCWVPRRWSWWWVFKKSNEIWSAQNSLKLFWIIFSLPGKWLICATKTWNIQLFYFHEFLLIFCLGRFRGRTCKYHYFNEIYITKQTLWTTLFIHQVCNDILVGDVSSGYGCGLKDYPGIYGRIAAPPIRKWIKKVSGLWNFFMT